MVRFWHIDDVGPIVTLANSYGISPDTDAAEVVSTYGLARSSGNWGTIQNYVNDNPGSDESEIAGATIGSNPTNDRLVLILMAIFETLGVVVSDA